MTHERCSNCLPIYDCSAGCQDPPHDSLHDKIGQAIADHLTSLAEDNVVTLDPFDARNIDAIVEEVMPVVKAELEQLLAAQEQVALDRAQLVDIVDKHLDGTYHCLRVWEAWRYGTMSEDDFLPVVDSETPHDLVDAIMKLIGGSK